MINTRDLLQTIHSQQSTNKRIIKMSSQSVPINSINNNQQKNADDWFDAFHFLPGQDEHIRWLSRPNQQFFHDTLTKDSEKFRITFDVENFQPDQIKVSQLTRRNEKIFIL